MSLSTLRDSAPWADEEVFAWNRLLSADLVTPYFLAVLDMFTELEDLRSASAASIEQVSVEISRVQERA